MMNGDESNRDATGPGNRSGSFSLRRWSQRKHEAMREAKTAAARRETDARPASVTPMHGATAPAAPAGATAARTPPAQAVSPSAVSATIASSEIGGVKAPAIELPPIESLTADSDFAPFMRTGVDPDLRREALKKLLHDARFNVMDGLDVYIDDYTKTTPIAPSLARELAARLHPRLDDERASMEQAPPAAVNPSSQMPQMLQVPQERAGAVAPAGPGSLVTDDEPAARPTEGAAPLPDAPRALQEDDRARRPQQENG